MCGVICVYVNEPLKVINFCIYSEESTQAQATYSPAMKLKIGLLDVPVATVDPH